MSDTGSQDAYSSSESHESWDSELEDVPLCQPTSPKARPANIPRLPIASMLQAGGAPRPAVPSLAKGFENLAALPRLELDWEPLPTSRGHRQREAPQPAQPSPAPAMPVPDIKPNMSGSLSSRIPHMMQQAQAAPKQRLHIHLLCSAFDLLDAEGSSLSSGAQNMIIKQCMQRFGACADQVELFSLTGLKAGQQHTHWGVQINPAPFTLKTVEQLMSERQTAAAHNLEHTHTIDIMYKDVKTLQADKDAAIAKNHELEAQLAELRQQLVRSEEDKGKLRRLIHSLRDRFESLILGTQHVKPLPVSADLARKARQAVTARAAPPAATTSVVDTKCGGAGGAPDAHGIATPTASTTPTQGTQALHDAEHSPRSSSPPSVDLYALPPPGPAPDSVAPPATRLGVPRVPKLALGDGKQLAGSGTDGLPRPESPEQPNIVRHSCVPTPDTLEAPPSTRSGRRTEGAAHSIGTPLELSFRRMEAEQGDCGCSSSGSEASTSPHYQATPTNSATKSLPGQLRLPRTSPEVPRGLTSTPSPALAAPQDATGASRLDGYSTTKTVPRINLGAVASPVEDTPPLTARGRR